VKITIEIPDEQLPVVLEAALEVNPNTETDKVANPDYVNDKTTPDTPRYIKQPRYTDEEWLAQLAIRRICHIVRNGARRKLEREAAAKMVDDPARFVKLVKESG